MPQDTLLPKPDPQDRSHAPKDLPLPLLCLGGAYIPLEQRSDGHTGRSAVDLPGVLEHHSFMVRRQGKKMMCVDHRDAKILGEGSGDVRVERRDGRFSVTCAVPKKKKHRSQPYLSVPLHFGLELVQSFPKSYLWLSQQAVHRKKNRLEILGVDEIGQIPIYSVPNLHITQICDTEQQLPVEYKTYFLSKRQLRQAWKSGRQYLAAASLASRQQKRQHAFDTLHAKAAVIASRGGWFIPPKSSHGSMDVNEDEDGLMEPAEVQEVAAELGMGGMPHLHHDPSESSFTQNAKSFVATFACGVIATLSPIIQGCSMACDSAIAAVPILDRLILGDSVPPRQAIMKQENMIQVLESVYSRNMEKLDIMEKTDVRGDAHTRLCKRLALSALWMGISMKLLLQQQVLGSPGASVLIASIPEDSGTPDVRQRNGNKKAQDPVVMDVLSSLIGSLQANEFVKTLARDDDSGSTTQSLQLEHILSLQNGLSIEYKKDINPTTKDAAEGIVFVGDITRPTSGTLSSQENPFARLMLDQLVVQVPVGVHNGRHLIQKGLSQSSSSSNSSSRR